LGPLLESLEDRLAKMVLACNYANGFLSHIFILVREMRSYSVKNLVVEV
jgi:hypothetical protein